METGLHRKFKWISLMMWPPQSRKKNVDWPPVDEFIGAKLSVFRTRAGLTTEDLSVRIGIPERELVRIEKGEKRISADKLFQLSEIFDVAVADFFRTGGAPA